MVATEAQERILNKALEFLFRPIREPNAKLGQFRAELKASNLASSSQPHDTGVPDARHTGFLNTHLALGDPLDRPAFQESPGHDGRTSRSTDLTLHDRVEIFRMEVPIPVST